MPKLPSDLAERAIRSARGLISKDPAQGAEDAPPARRSEAALPAPGRIGKYDQPLADLVRAEPGLTVAEAAARLGVHPTALYPVIRRLETKAQLVKLGRELHPPSSSGTGKLERLWCEAGHHWTRPLVRGRKPRRCPTHR